MLDVKWVSKLLNYKKEETAKEFINWALWRGEFNPLCFCLIQNLLHGQCYGNFALFLVNNFCTEDSPFKINIDKKLYLKKDESVIKLWSQESELYYEFPGGPEELIKFWSKLQKLAKSDIKAILPHEAFSKIELALEKSLKETVGQYLEAKKGTKPGSRPGKSGQKPHKLDEKIEKKWLKSASILMSEFGIDVEFTMKKPAAHCTCPDCVVHAT